MKLKNKAKQKTQHPPSAEFANRGENGPRDQTGSQTPGGWGGSHPPCMAVTSCPPWGEPAIRVTPSRSD